MPKYIVVILGLALLSTVASVAGARPIVGTIAMGLFGLVMILTLLTAINDSDKRPL